MLDSSIQALKLYLYYIDILLRMLFGAIVGSAKIAIIIQYPSLSPNAKLWADHERLILSDNKLTEVGTVEVSRTFM